MKDKHSPLPWKDNEDHTIDDANGKPVVEAVPYEGNWWSNKEHDVPFVIKCVNRSPAFDALVEALERIKAEAYGEKEWSKVVDLSSSALQLARGAR